MKVTLPASAIATQVLPIDQDHAERAAAAPDIPSLPLHRLGTSSVSARFPSVHPPLTTIVEQEEHETDPLGRRHSADSPHLWLPNDLWRSITQFSSRGEVLKLRATNSSVYVQADQALTTMTLQPHDIEAFLASPGFKHVKTVCIQDPNDDSVARLVTHLETHPRPSLTLRLSTEIVSSPTSLLQGRQFTTDTLARLKDLSLAALQIDKVLAFNSIDTLKALAECPFPVDLVGAFSRQTLVAASRIAMLRSITIYGMEFDDDLARLFSTHRALEDVSIGASRDVSSEGIAALASLPTLRALSVDEWFDRALIDATSASALAANPALETLRVTAGEGLAEESFALLSRSQSLTTLQVHFRENMAELGNMVSLRHLTFTPSAWAAPVNLDLVSATSMAKLPALQTIGFPNMKAEAGALTTIFKQSAAHTIAFDGYYAFDPEELSALLANTHLRELAFRKGGMHQNTIDAVLRHPTLERVRIMGNEFHRVSGRATLMDVTDMGKG